MTPDPTQAIYEQRAEEWRTERGPGPLDRLERFSAEGPVLDVGCGPGWHAGALPTPVIAIDTSMAMLRFVPEYAPDALCVQADLGALPIRRNAAGGAWASKSYVHVPRAELPMVLAELHRTLRVGGRVELHMFHGDLDHGEMPDDSFAGRRFARWQPDHLRDVVTGAGFTVENVDLERELDLHVSGDRARTLPDTVGPGMRILCCGLNPSLYSADVGVGFARPGNRFWPAVLAAGLARTDRDPVAALREHGLGMTDLVKRATRAAAELSAAEFVDGLARIERLARWLEPAVVCFVGLTGWRAAVDRLAVAGPQPRALGGRPVYVMPNTSGLNAHSKPADFVDHLRAAVQLGARSRTA